MPEATYTPGSDLRTERERTGVSVAALARHLSMSRATVYDWEDESELDEIRTTKYRRALESAKAAALGKSA